MDDCLFPCTEFSQSLLDAFLSIPLPPKRHFHVFVQGRETQKPEINDFITHQPLDMSYHVSVVCNNNTLQIVIIILTSGFLAGVNQIFCVYITKKIASQTKKLN